MKDFSLKVGIFILPRPSKISHLFSSLARSAPVGICLRGFTGVPTPKVRLTTSQIPLLLLQFRLKKPAPPYLNCHRALGLFQYSLVTQK